MTVLLTLGLTVACGASDDDGTPYDGGDKSSADGGSSSDGGRTDDGATPADGGGTADAGASGDSGSADGGHPADGAIVHPAGAMVVNLGSAADFVILAKSGISTVPNAAVTGNIGVSPAAASYVTGFGLTADATNVFSTSPQVSGKVYAADHASPTPSNMTTAIQDMELATTEAAGRAASVTELGAGNIGGKTLAPGVYKWSSALLVPTDVTLTGPSTGVWIFQVAQDVTFSSATKIVLAGGALPQNVFWQVGGQVELGTTAHLEGIVLAQTAIMLRTGASVRGRLFSQTAVVLDASAVIQPAP